MLSFVDLLTRQAPPESAPPVESVRRNTLMAYDAEEMASAKRCCDCGELKPLDEFYTESRRCKVCDKARARARYVPKKRPDAPYIRQMLEALGDDSLFVADLAERTGERHDVVSWRMQRLQKLGHVTSVLLKGPQNIMVRRYTRVKQ